MTSPTVQHYEQAIEEAIDEGFSASWCKRRAQQLANADARDNQTEKSK